MMQSLYYIKNKKFYKKFANKRITIKVKPLTLKKMTICC